MNDNFFSVCDNRQEVYWYFVGAVEQVMKSYESGEYTKVKAFNQLYEFFKDQIEWIQFLEGVL